MSRLPRIAFATREVWPFVQGGGLGRAVWACARLLAPHAEVTIVTSDDHRAEYEALVAAGDQRLPEGVRYAFAHEPGDDVGPWRSWHQAWSAALLDAVVEAHPDGMPDLLELPDYLAEAAVPAEAKRSGDPRLRDTLVLNRVHTTFEVATTLNRVPEEPGWDILRGLERVGLHSADRLLWPGGDVLGTYERFYGAARLARPQRLDLAFTLNGDEPETRLPPEGPTRLLYFGRLEWRKGVHNLVQAVRELPAADLRLTLLGRDTPTGPGGTSLKAHLETLIGDDTRIAFHDQVPEERIGEFIRSHHLVVAPSLWESWSNVVREALMHNRPVLATPVGAMTEVVQPGRSGWLTADNGLRSLRHALARVLGERDALDELIRDGVPRAVIEESLDQDAIVEGYLALAREAAAAGPAAVTPRVPPTVVVSCRRSERGRLVATLDAVASQTLPARVLLVCDSPASLPRVGAVEHVTEVIALPEGPDFHARARRIGLLRAPRGSAVAFLEPGDLLEPGFLERAQAGLASAAYVAAIGGIPTAPLGNVVAGDVGEPAAVALYRRDALDFELPAGTDDLHDDQVLVSALAERGRLGTVVPEPLLRAAAPRRRRAYPSGEVDGRSEPALELWLAPWDEGDSHPRETAARAAVSDERAS